MVAILWSTMSWNLKLFEFMTTPLGDYTCSDDNTKNQAKMNVACILIRTKFTLVQNDTFNVQINIEDYWIKNVEDS